MNGINEIAIITVERVLRELEQRKIGNGSYPNEYIFFRVETTRILIKKINSTIRKIKENYNVIYLKCYCKNVYAFRQITFFV